jgi:hypothetical protein
MDTEKTELNAEPLLEAYAAEQLKHKDDEFAVSLKLHQVSAVIGNLQLALRHPGNQGLTHDIAEAICHLLIDEMERRGLHFSARVARMGFDPRLSD